jgi:predicted FMN-binding regulatory protein PaiB
MYIPAAFAEADLTKLHDFIEQHSFGLLVSQAAVKETPLAFVRSMERFTGTASAAAASFWVRSLIIAAPSSDTLTV